jgi:hypothetical protein
MSEVVLQKTADVYDQIILALQNGARIIRVKDFTDCDKAWATNGAFGALKTRRGWYNLRLAKDEKDLVVYNRKD